MGNEREIESIARYVQYLVSFFTTIPLRSYYFFRHSVERLQRAGCSGRSYLSLLAFVTLRTLERKTHISLFSLLPLQSYRTLNNEYTSLRTISIRSDGIGAKMMTMMRSLLTGGPRSPFGPGNPCSPCGPGGPGGPLTPSIPGSPF